MTIITSTELKTYLGSKASSFTNAELNAIISEVNLEIQQELNVDIFREYITYISRARQNNINGTNTTFYIFNYLDKFFADRNGDGSVTIADMKIYAVDSEGVETNPTISSFDNANRSITLATAPESVQLYIDYSYSFYDMDTPDNRIKILAKYLSLSYCYFELELDLVGTSVKMGNISYSGINTNSKTSKYNKRYMKLLNELKTYGTSKNKPTEFKITKPLNYRPDRKYGYRGHGGYYGYGGYYSGNDVGYYGVVYPYGV